MRNHTTPKIWELSGPQGETPTVQPTAIGGQKTTFNLTALPTGKQGKFWYYLASIVIAMSFTITLTNSGEGGITEIPQSAFWRMLSSCQVYTPTLGTLYTHANTPGNVLGNLIQYIGMGYNTVGKLNTLTNAAGAGTTAYTVTQYYRIPFAHEFLRKPHETSPWAGFLEGGTLELITAGSNYLDNFTNTGITATISSITMRSWMELLPSPEACIHTPFNWRIHNNIAASSSRITIPDLGSPDGLTGIDQSKGVGVHYLGFLSSAAETAFGGSTTADNIQQLDIPWRDQTRIKDPDAFVMAQLAMMGPSRRRVSNGTTAGGVTIPIPNDRLDFPNLDTQALGDPNGPLNDANTMAFPFVASGRDTETSKLQTVAGAKDINIAYGVAPTTPPILLGGYFAVFDDAFIQTVLVPRISPSQAGTAELTAKTLNKQSGGILGVGKLAYVRQKIQGAGAT